MSAISWVKGSFTLGVMALISAPAQDTEAPVPLGWSNELLGGVNLTQSSFDNWAQGGENAWSWQVNFTARSVDRRDNYTWINRGRFAYGQTSIGDQEPRKSADELRFQSLLSFNSGWLLNPYISVTEETQLTSGFNYAVEPPVKVSGFMDPAYFTQGIGLGYDTPLEGLHTRSGLGFKQTITRNHPVPYSDNPDTPQLEKFRSEIGMDWVTELHRMLTESIILDSKLKFFTNFEGVEKIDGEWDTYLIAKVHEFVNMNFNVRVVYDRDISATHQIKQVLALGLVYNFI